MFCKVFLSVIVFLLLAFVLNNVFHSGCPNPVMSEGHWDEEDRSVQRYKIEVNSTVLEDLKERLKTSRLPQSLRGTQFSYGLHSDYMAEVLNYWRDMYDWRKHELMLNALPQYITRIEGVRIHFVRVIPSHRTVHSKPLLTLHGWPGSVWEFYKMIPLLTESSGNQPLFEVILASIPGFAFSEAAQKPGFDMVDAARIFHKLMLRLGHSRFFIHAEDWGTFVATIMAQAYPQNVAGIHLTMAPPAGFSFRYLVDNVLFALWPSLFLTEDEKTTYPSTMELIRWTLEESGYFHLQATKPDTIAYGLVDSPVGLAAYMLEKFLTCGSNSEKFCVADCKQEYSLDEVLTNVMIYWITGSMTSSMRFYKEYVISEKVAGWKSVPVTVPSGFSIFPKDLRKPVKYMVAHQFVNIVRYKNMRGGGHFAAFENPKIVAEEIREFVQDVTAYRAD